MSQRPLYSRCISKFSLGGCVACCIATSRLWCSQFLHETGPGLVPASLNKQVFFSSSNTGGLTAACAFLAPARISDFSWVYLATSAYNQAELFVADLAIYECARDMVCDGIQLALRQHSDVVMLFGFDREEPANEFSRHSKDATGHGCNFKAQDNWGCNNGGQESHAPDTHSHAGCEQRCVNPIYSVDPAVVFLYSAARLSLSSSRCFFSCEISWSR